VVENKTIPHRISNKHVEVISKTMSNC